MDRIYTQGRIRIRDHNYKTSLLLILFCYSSIWGRPPSYFWGSIHICQSTSKRTRIGIHPYNSKFHKAKILDSICKWTRKSSCLNNCIDPCHSRIWIHYLSNKHSWARNHSLAHRNRCTSSQDMPSIFACLSEPSPRNMRSCQSRCSFCHRGRNQHNSCTS